MSTFFKVLFVADMVIGAGCIGFALRDLLAGVHDGVGLTFALGASNFLCAYLIYKRGY